MSEINDKVKSTTRQVSRWARRTGDAVSQWWEDVNALQSRRNEIRDLARQRQQLLIDMGNKVYTLHRKGKVQNRDLMADCAKVDLIGEDIARLEREIEELRRRAAEEPGAVEISDESPIVGEEDIDTSATEIEVRVEDTPEVEKEATEPCAHAQAAVEGPAEEDEGDDVRVECAPDDEEVIDFAAPEAQQETDKEGEVPCAHSEAAVEGPTEGDEGDDQRPECDR